MSTPSPDSVSRIDISPELPISTPTPVSDAADQGRVTALLERMVELQQEQLELAKKMTAAAEEAQRRRRADAKQWQEKNPELASRCRRALEVLDQVQWSFLDQMAQFVTEHDESLVDGEFMLTEFVDRFGPRMAHLSGILGMLNQLAGGASPPPNND